ncbi:MAG TPA: RNA 2',3'-cyclic phosphodiesterase [Firmicutes bacterium]|nr:RNA 2',3'-cyclic phosphodiesterase [Bacillota bacterium]
MSRIFFAIMLPGEVRERLALLQRALDLEPGAVKWVEKQNLHLTLQFIGEIPLEKIRPILDGAARTAAATAIFTLEVRGAGAFPGPLRPRVLWAGAGEGEKQTRQLAEELSRCIGIAPDKPFSPHITLGRVREGRTVRIGNALSRELSYSAGSVCVERFLCLESMLTARGPRYREIAVFKLK